MYCCQLSRLPVPNLHRLQNQHRFTRNETLIWNFIGTFFKNIFNGKTPHLDNYTLCYIEMMCGCQLQNDEHTLPVIIHLPATY